mgnify:CR=1 FL=1
MPNRKQAHSVVTQGKRAIVRLKDGTMFVDKFRRNEKGHLYFDEHTIKQKDLQMMSIYREQPERDKRADEAIAKIPVKLPKQAKALLRAALKKQLK